MKLHKFILLILLGLFTNGSTANFTANSTADLWIPLLNGIEIDIESNFQRQSEELLDNFLTRAIQEMERSRGITDTIRQFWRDRPRYPFMPDLSALKQVLQWKSKSANSFAVCSACKTGFGLFLSKARSWWVSFPETMKRATYGCGLFRIASPEVCSGLIKRFAPMLHYIARRRRELTSATFCGVTLQSFGCSATTPQIQWTIEPEIEATIIKASENDTAVQDNNTTVSLLEFPNNMKTLKILHLTDIHVDPEYEPGSMKNCKAELCCRQNSSQLKVDDKAGFFGDYNKCDLPLHSFEDALQHITTTHRNIDLIYMTGDLVPHNSWDTSVQTNMDIISGITAWLKEYFPTTKVIPVLGNHESHPANLFSPKGVPEEFSTDWVYNTTASAWEGWIPAESLQSFLNGGFYDIQISEKFRVVVLNTNLCMTYNFWQVYKHVDPGGQLKWLIQVLNKSESLGEKVHILSHVPPSQNECWSIWGRNYYKIVNRFKSVIVAQFYGHTHFDEFQIYYDDDGDHKPISPVWVGASLTPYSKLNPGYKIFEVDGSRGLNSTWNVVDHETWIFNLKEANMNPKVPPKWFKLYRATEAFDIPNVLPNSLDKFVDTMATNLTLFEKYYRYYHKETDESLKQECDTFCRKEILCTIVTPYFSEESECNRMKLKIDGFWLPEVILGDI